MTPLDVAMTAVPLLAGVSLGALWWDCRLARRRRREDAARDRILEEVLSRKPGTRAEFLALIEDFRPKWLGLGDFLEGVLHTGGRGPSLPSMAWHAIDAAKPAATDTEHVVRALLEAERARERGAAIGAACTSCPLHCRPKHAKGNA